MSPGARGRHSAAGASRAAKARAPLPARAQPLPRCGRFPADAAPRLRCVAAFALVGMLVAAVPLSQGDLAALAVGGAAGPGACSDGGTPAAGPSGSEAAAEEADARSLWRGIVFGEGTASGRWGGSLPPWLLAAAPSSAKAAEVAVDEGLGIAGFVLPGETQEVFAVLGGELQRHGWEFAPGGSLQGTFWKERAAADDDPSWASVACTQVGEEVSVVVCYR